MCAALFFLLFRFFQSAFSKGLQANTQGSTLPIDWKKCETRTSLNLLDNISRFQCLNRTIRMFLICCCLHFIHHKYSLLSDRINEKKKRKMSMKRISFSYFDIHRNRKSHRNNNAKECSTCGKSFFSSLSLVFSLSRLISKKNHQQSTCSRFNLFFILVQDDGSCKIIDSSL